MTEPVNKFPDFVRYIVRQMKAYFPRLGRVRIAQVLARTGLHLGATTVRRMWEKEDTGAEESVQLLETEAEKPRVVTAKYPGHVWNVDLTVVPTKAGFWKNRF